MYVRSYSPKHFLINKDFMRLYVSRGDSKGHVAVSRRKRTSSFVSLMCCITAFKRKPYVLLLLTRGPSKEYKDLVTSYGHLWHCRKTHNPQSRSPSPSPQRLVTAAKRRSDGTLGTRWCVDSCQRWDDRLRRHETANSVLIERKVMPLLWVVDSKSFESRVTLFKHHC